MVWSRCGGGRRYSWRGTIKLKGIGKKMAKRERARRREDEKKKWRGTREKDG
jgi:hypothetical protein